MRHSDWLREHAAHMESCCDAYESGQMYDDAQQCKEIADALDAAEAFISALPHAQSCKWWGYEPCNCGIDAVMEHFNE